jgi:hypothetical protein
VRTPAEYRREAENYVRCADDLTDPIRRERLLHMAQSCLRLAQQAEWLSPATYEEPAGQQRVFSGL